MSVCEHFSQRATCPPRDNKVYINGSPAFPVAGPSIYFDIEGIPGRQFYYLFGMFVVTDTIESYQSFWVNDKSEQGGIFVKFCESVAAHSDAALFHYGNYEVKALKNMRECIGDKYRSLVDHLLGSSHNVLSVLHHHCYFPTYSNRLKDVARFLGYEFNNTIQSGVESIVFRERWEEAADDVLKDALIPVARAHVWFEDLGSAQRPHCMPDEPVTFEPISDPNSRITGKKTGKIGKLSLKRRRHHHQTQDPYGFLEKFLVKINRERFRRNRETNEQITGKTSSLSQFGLRSLYGTSVDLLEWRNPHLVHRF
jgi:hypothetical protein